MKINEIPTVFILILLIFCILPGCKKSTVEPEIDHYKGKIAFYSNRDGKFEVYIMNGNGSNQINLTNHEGYDYSPVFQPQ